MSDYCRNAQTTVGLLFVIGGVADAATYKTYVYDGNDFEYRYPSSTSYPGNSNGQWTTTPPDISWTNYHPPGRFYGETDNVEIRIRDSAVAKPITLQDNDAYFADFNSGL